MNRNHRSCSLSRLVLVLLALQLQCGILLSSGQILLYLSTAALKHLQSTNTELSSSTSSADETRQPIMKLHQPVSFFRNRIAAIYIRHFDWLQGIELGPILLLMQQDAALLLGCLPSGSLLMQSTATALAVAIWSTWRPTKCHFHSKCYSGLTLHKSIIDTELRRLVLNRR